MKRAIRMNDRDSVATALGDVKAGDTVGIFDNENTLLYDMKAEEDIPFGNKIALKALKTGDMLIKYNAVVGECTADIKRGCLVHVHNVKSRTVDIPPAIRREIMRQMNIEEAVK